MEKYDRQKCDITETNQTKCFNQIMFYVVLLKGYAEKKKVESKMLSALLTGVNRAFPYSKSRLSFCFNEGFFCEY